MKAQETIEHKGVITSISENEMQVSIMSKSACASCSVKGACNVSEIDDKIVDVTVINPENYSIGETVKIYYNQSLGFRALFLGYVLPFIIILTVLIISMAITQNEALSGILAISSTVPYYVIIYFQKSRLKKTFSFSVEKENIFNTKNFINES